MYRFCPLCKNRDIVVLYKHSEYSEFLGEDCAYTKFECKACGYHFCIDAKYLIDEQENIQREQGMV